MPVRRRHIHALVERLLHSAHVDVAPIDVVKLAKGLGADVQYQPADENLSGFILRNRKERRAIIGVNSTHHEKPSAIHDRP